MKNFKNLDKINWDFNDALTNFSVHSFHWYLGTFIPQIPSILISNFTNRGDMSSRSILWWWNHISRSHEIKKTIHRCGLKYSWLLNFEG